jgi:hypothetical protein
MRALRYVYVLALAIWLGGMVIAGLVVAPVTFDILEARNPGSGRVWAGELFGAILARLHIVGYIAAGLMFAALTVQRVLGPRPKSYGIRVTIIALMLGLTAYSGVLLAPRINRLQAEVDGPMNRLPVDDVRRLEFDRLHNLSTTLVMATIVGGLVLLGWETRE